MLCLSAAYNLWPISQTKWLLRRFDHAAIYLLIASTYTPFLVHGMDAVRFLLLAAIWTMACAGMALKLAYPGRFDRLAILLYLGLAGATGYVARIVPTGFIPPQDAGYLIAVVQLPDGAALTRTDEVTRRASEIMLATPGVAHAVAIGGLSGSTFTNATNAAVLFAPLKPFPERVRQNLPAGAIAGDIVRRMGAIPEAFIIAIPPPPVRGLGNAGGFRLQVEDRSGQGVRPLLAAAQEVIGRANRDPRLSRVFTPFGANTPQIFLEIDRVKARMLAVPLANIFATLQVHLGGAYVNDFNAFGRIYQVRAQAAERFREEREDILRLKVRSSTGALVPLGSLVNITDTAGPDLVQRYNMYTSVPIQGEAARGVSTGTSLSAMEAIARQALPEGLSFEWTEIAFQERATGNTAIFIFALSVLFVFLVLSAQYESWALPLAIILIVPMSVLAALLGVMLRGQDNNILTQIGLVVLVGLAAKNAILIVEFAKQAEEEGKNPVDAVVEAARLRLRPILITAFAFILGVVPLVIATGPGAEMRQALGTAVLFGMLGATVFGLFLTPVFYVVIRHLLIRINRWRGREEPGTR